jgi:hypothetical protein
MQECKDGYELRKGYTRKFKNSILRNGYTVRRKGKLFKVRPEKSSAYISSMCVKKKSKKWIGKLRKGDLIRYGYQYRLSDRLREAALRKAIEVYGATSTYHKLDAVAKLSVRIAPDASAIFKRDRDWILRHFVKK